MSECVVSMKMPHVCITENGYYGYCPMDRVWCIQRNAPPDITMREAYEAMTDKIPSWCPIICQLPEGHGRLIDWDAFERAGFKLCRKTSGWRAELGAPTNESYVVPAERSDT